MRELEQAVRRILLTGECSFPSATTDRCPDFETRFRQGTYTAEQLLSEYCGRIYERTGTYEAVARRVGLDRRTVKKHVDAYRTVLAAPQV